MKTLFFLLLSFPCFCQVDNIWVTIPLRVADSLEGAYQREQQYKVLSFQQQSHIKLLSEQNTILTTMNEGSLVLIADLRAIKKASQNESIQLSGAVRVEKKRRITNGIWRDVFIVTTAAAIYIAITNQNK